MPGRHARGWVERLIAGGACLLLISGCFGDTEASLGGPAELPGASAPPAQAPEVQPPVQSQGIGLSEANWSRLIRREYQNAVNALLGFYPPADLLPPDEKLAGFEMNGLVPISAPVVERYHSAAREIAAMADLAGVFPCASSPDAEVDACVRQFATTFASRAFRRPVDEETLTRLLAVYAVGVTEGGSRIEGARLLIQAVLSSPWFLYRVELGKPGPEEGVIQLTSHEVAARLSFLFWDNLPDAELQAAADADLLTTREQVMAQALRMFDDPRTDNRLRYFFSQWLGLEALLGAERTAPEFSATLAQQMVRETQDFSLDVLRNGDRTLSSLLTASHTVASPLVLRDIYGLQTTATGPTKVALDPSQRAGLLTSPAVLALTAHGDHTSIVLRGLMIRANFLCQQLPPPPEGVDAVDLGLPPDPTERQKSEARMKNTTCVGCHRLMDPVGYGFETFDPIGRFRAELPEGPIDPSGELVGSDVAGTFVGAVQLAAKLSQSKVVERCYATQWARFVLSRDLHPDHDQAVLDGAAAALADSGQDTRALIVALTGSDAFRFRRIPASKN